MTIQGRSNFKGINSQAWAAMSLFLQFLSKQDFSHIIFEGERLEDFCLVFNDGKKIICESKDYSNGINYSELREILAKVAKHNQVNPIDEILITCPTVSPDVINDIEHLKYFKQQIETKLQSKKHKFTKTEIAFLPQVRFWQINQTISQKTVEALITHLLGIWVPRHVLTEIVCNFMIIEVYFGSQYGETLTKKEFLDQLENRKKKAITDISYEDERQTFDKRLEGFIKLVRKSPADRALLNDQITYLSSRPNEYCFLIDLLKEKNVKLDLKTWDSFWKSVVQSAHSFNLFDIFENNLDSQDNIDYAVNFCLDFLDQGYNLIRDEFINTDIAKLCGKILDLTNEYNEKIFEIIQRLLKPKLKEYFYAFNIRDRRWEIEQIGKLFEKLYLKSSDGLKNQIIEYILQSFNLVEDEGFFWDDVSPEIFRILKSYYEQDPEEGISELTKIISEQYSKSYKKYGKKLEFKGWEHFGMSISNFGGSFSAGDRHFVNQLIVPILSKYYHQQPEKAWQFIGKKCISRKITEVSSKKPDFLNRAAIDIILEEYGTGENKQEAYEILRDFIAMRKGIPWKNDLIFQGLRNNSQISDDDKWKLVNFSFKKFKGLPVNVFVEQIVSKLAEKDRKEAIDIIVSWSSNPEYLKRQKIGSFHIAENVNKLLSNAGTYDSGVSSLLNFIRQENFSKMDNFDVYDIAKLLTKIIEDKPETGLTILQEIYDKQTLLLNDQTLIASSIEKIADEKKEIILSIFEQFLQPNFSKLNQSQLEKKFNSRHIREEFVRYVEKLAKIEKFDEAVWFLEKFINDSDPPRDGKNYPDDLKGDWNYHQKLKDGDDEMVITTVRGWCGQVLSSLAVAGNQKGMPGVIKIAEKLSRDPNNYVRYELCTSLSHIVKNRRTYLPGEKKIPFLKKEDSKKIENTVFYMLRDKRNHKIKALMKRLIDVFGGMRGISETEAKEFLKTVLDTKMDEVIAEAVPFFVYFAEFRENDFKSDTIKELYTDKWDSIKDFKDQSFKKLIEDLIKKGFPATKANLAWQFCNLPNEDKGNESLIKISFKYLNKLANINYNHEVYERIYSFIEDQNDKYAKESLALWKKCLEKEKPAIKKLSKDKGDENRYNWYPYYYNDKILIKLAEKEGNKEFLKWFDFLLDYPEEVSISVKEAIDHLKTIKGNDKVVEATFNRLMKRNANFYNDKQEWIKLNQNIE